MKRYIIKLELLNKLLNDNVLNRNFNSILDLIVKEFDIIKDEMFEKGLIERELYNEFDLDIFIKKVK